MYHAAKEHKVVEAVRKDVLSIMGIRGIYIKNTERNCLILVNNVHFIT